MTAFTAIADIAMAKGPVPLVTECTVDSPCLTDEVMYSDDLLISRVSGVSYDSAVLMLATQGFTSHYSKDRLSGHATEICAQFNEALQQNSPLTMLANYNIRATGRELGLYLVIDLGGSTLRVAVIDIAAPVLDNETDRSSRISVVIENKWEINDSFKNIDRLFFDFIASKIIETLRGQTLIAAQPDKVINMGITWSFPLDHVSHNRGKMLHVSKGYTIDPEVHGHDLKEEVEAAMLRQNLCVDVKVIVNDSLAVYAAGSFMDPYMKLAMVLGTGQNMCCSLQTPKLHRNKTLGEDAVLLNSELSMFGVNLLEDLSTAYDKVIDNRFNRSTLLFKPHMEMDPETNSIFQPSELMVSGRYLPELTRLVMVDMIRDGDLFADIEPEALAQLYTPYEGFTGELLCAVCEGKDNQKTAAKLASHYGFSQLVCEDDLAKIRAVGNCVIERAAYIVASTIIAFIKLLHEHNGPFTSNLVDIGFVGSVLMYFHSYRQKILQFVNENEDIRALGLEADLKPIENSSIVGAAIGAAYYVGTE